MHAEDHNSNHFVYTRKTVNTQRLRLHSQLLIPNGYAYEEKVPLRSACCSQHPSVHNGLYGSLSSVVSDRRCHPSVYQSTKSRVEVAVHLMVFLWSPLEPSGGAAKIGVRGSMSTTAPFQSFFHRCDTFGIHGLFALNRAENCSRL